jgi:hypothetical protein
MNHPERGQALTVAISGFALVLLLMSAALITTQYSGRIVGRRLQYQGQALNAARAGLTDALSWFRRQQGVVTTFDPDESINDTEDQDTGIVRTFEMSDAFSLWGRFTVPKTTVTDITVQKGKTGAGTVWQLESTGCVSTNLFNFPYDCKQASPNIIARETVRAEIQRLNLLLPAGGAAIYARRGGLVDINGISKVRGSSGISIAYPSGTGSPSIEGASVVTPNGIADGTTPAPIKIQDVFGVTTQELLTMADRNVTSLSELENPMPSMSLIIIRGNATFDSTFPLNGSGILVIFGDLTIPANTNNIFSGVIYVTGNVTIAQPSLISGAIIAAGNGDTSTSGTGGAVTINSSGDTAEVDYDPAFVQLIREQMGFYRFSRRMYIPGKQAI